MATRFSEVREFREILGEIYGREINIKESLREVIDKSFLSQLFKKVLEQARKIASKIDDESAEGLLEEIAATLVEVGDFNSAKKILSEIEDPDFQEEVAIAEAIARAKDFQLTQEKASERNPYFQARALIALARLLVIALK